MRKNKSVTENAISLAMDKRAGRKPSEDVTVERLTDILVFATAAMLFENVSDGEDASESHLEAGEKLFRRYYDAQQSGVEKYILPLVELPNFARFKPAVERSLRTQDRSNYRHFISNVMPLIAHLTLQPVKFREVFTGRSAKVMRTLVNEVWGNDDLDLLDPLSLAPFPKIPSVSAAPALRAWSKQAAVLCGLSLASEDVDVAVADAETASNIGDEINKIDHKIGAADPMTQESADLQLERIDLQSSLQDAVDDSENPALSLATAVQALKADATPDYLRNLDDEKIAYVYSEGKTLLNAGAGSGKAQPITEPVLTPSGFRAIGDLCVGDEVIGVDGKPTTVVGVYPQGMKEIFKVEMTDGSFTHCCEEHLWKTQTTKEYDTGKSGKVRSLADIRKSLLFRKKTPRFNHRIPIMTACEGEQVDHVIEPYVMGALLGDGSFQKDGITLTSVDAEILDQVRSNLLEGYSLSQLGNSISYNLRSDANSKWMSARKKCEDAPGPLGANVYLQEMRKLDLELCTSYHKFIPSSYKKGTLEQRLRLLQGLMDTDGGVSRDSGQPEFYTSSKTLADDVRELVWSLGGTCSMRSKIPTYTYLGETLKGAEAYTLVLNLPDNIQPFLLQRKTALVRARTKYFPTRRIASIESVGHQEAVCIAVDHPEHLYVTKDYIVTHNTLGVTCRIKYLIEEKGIHPDQIIACSFTKAASAEIADRLKNKFGIEGKYIGRTSNSLAYNIVTQYRPDLAAALRNGSKADALMRYAFKQLTLKGTESYVSNRANSPYATRAIAVDNPSLSWIHMGKEPVDSEGKPIRFRQLTLTISKWKNDLYKPEDARQMPNPSPYHRAATAMYAAYEWLKRYEPTMSPCLDFDDQHVVAYETLRDQAQIRERIQGQFRVVIIDEGQDYNKLQMKLFGLISGKAEYVDYVGDDRQCQNVDTIVQTEAGPKRSDELVVGDSILAYRNGSVMMQKVAHIQGTDWDYGYEFVTESGKHLHITPNHKIWADTDMALLGEDHVVYLMYRPGYGFRVGVSRNQPNIYGRAGQEGASHMWILHQAPSLAEALYLEESVSLTYGIPTIVYNGKKRGMDQARIEKIFQNFGSNGYKVLKDFHLSFEMPNWIASSYSKHGRTSRTIYLKGHTSQSTHVLLEWSGSDLDALINPEWVTDARIGKRIRKYFSSYQEGLLFANQLKDLTGANVAHQLSVPEGLLKKIPAASLFVGMKVPVLDAEGRVVLENIISKTRKSGTFISIQVDDASNFFGNGILSSNSIYGFRGAAPEEFVNLRDIGDFKVLNMQTNYRSGSSIVNAGEQLIAYNTDQLPKTCRAEISRGDGLIRYEEPETHQEAATRIATEIQDGILNGGADPSSFGVVVRNNAEKDAVMLSLIARGIPYRSNSDTDYFNNPAVRSMLAWVGVATMIDPSEVKDRTEALKAALKFPSFPDFKLPYRYIENLEGKYRSADLVGDVMRDRTKDAGVQQLQKSIDSLERLAMQEDTGLLISSILNLQGQTGSMLSVLAEGVDVDKMIEEGLNPDEITKEMMEERVLATFEPIRDLAAVRPTPRAFLDVLRKLKAANVKCKKGAKSAGNIEPAVQIDTCHQWKGLEAESVFVIMAKGVWPSSRNENDKAIAEERRLAYVAITRGRDRVKVMCPQTAYNGKVGGGASQFVTEACIQPENGMNKKSAGKKVKKSSRRSMYEIANLIDQPDFLGEVF